MGTASSAFIVAIQACEGAEEAAAAFGNQAPDLVTKIQTAIGEYDTIAKKWNSAYNGSSTSDQEAVREMWPNGTVVVLGEQKYGATVGYCSTLNEADWATSDPATASKVVALVEAANGKAKTTAYGSYDGFLSGVMGLTSTSGGTQSGTLDTYLGVDEGLIYTVGDKFFESAGGSTISWLVGGGVWGSALNWATGVDSQEIVEDLALSAAETGNLGQDTALGILSKSMENFSQEDAASLVEKHQALQALQEELLGLMNAYSEIIAECKEEAMEEGSNWFGQVCADSSDFITVACKDWPLVDMQTDAEAEAGRLKANALGSGLGMAMAAMNFAGARNLKEQCFLLAKIFDLAAYKKETIEPKAPKKLPYYEKVPLSASVSNACIMAEGESYGFINRLTQSPSQAYFYDMPTDVISTLQPAIRLFKVNLEEDEESGEITETEQEYKFDSNTTREDIENLFSENGKRGFGVGIKDFSFTYDGNNPFAAKKSIKAKLTIFANSFDELLRDRGGYSYIELALKTGSGKGAIETSSLTAEQLKTRKANLEKLNFRLKAVSGWAYPGGKLTYNAYSAIDAINDSFITINLTPTTHDFNIDQQGRVNFVIHYLAYVDDAFDQPKYNVFSKIDVSIDTYKRTLRYKTLKKECKASELSDIKKQDLKDDVIDAEKKRSLLSVMGALLSTDKMRYINISYDDILKFQTEGPYAELKGGANVSSLISTSDGSVGSVVQQLSTVYSQALATARAEGEEAALQLSMAANNPTMNNIPFFYVSDLIDVILEGIDVNLEELPQKLNDDPDIKKMLKDKEIAQEDLDEEIKDLKKYSLNYKKLRVLLGPLEIVNPKEKSTSKFVNFGDIPISAKYFTEWITEKMIKKEQSVYPLSRFLNDFFNNLIRNFLNDGDCFGETAKQKTVLNQAVLTSYKNQDGSGNASKYDEITQYMIGSSTYSSKNKNVWLSRALLDPAKGGMPQPILNIAGSRGTPSANAGQEREINYLAFFAGRAQPAELMNGIREDDEARGIFHYILGKPTGIVKSIDLSKTDAKYLKEVRFEQEGYDGLEQLREVYDVKIKTYANVGAFPGAYIYVDPQGFAPNSIVDGVPFDLTQFGIGGYCMIIRNETTFGAGSAETTLTAKWVASIGAKTTQDPPEKEENEDTEGATSSNPLCSAGNREEAAADVGWLESIVDWIGFDEDSVAEKVEGALPL